MCKAKKLYSHRRENNEIRDLFLSRPINFSDPEGDLLFCSAGWVWPLDDQLTAFPPKIINGHIEQRWVRFLQPLPNSNWQQQLPAYIHATLSIFVFFERARGEFSTHSPTQAPIRSGATHIHTCAECNGGRRMSSPLIWMPNYGVIGHTTSCNLCIRRGGRAGKRMYNTAAMQDHI